MPDTTPQVRVGDRERRTVDDRLRAALGEGVLTLAEYDERCGAVWGARTRAELDDLVADLPPPAHGAAPERTRPGGGTAARLRGVGVPALLAAAAAGVLVSGTDGRALFGSDELVLPASQPQAAVSVLFGSVRVVVPDDVRVDTSGLVAFGSLSCADACAPRDGAREVSLRGLGAFGSVEVMTADEAAAADERDRAEELLDELDDDD